jgi:hypothetical protein
MRKIKKLLLSLLMLSSTACANFFPNPPATPAVLGKRPTPAVEETDLPFETIARGDSGGLPATTPGMLVITSQDQIQQY